MANSCVAYYDQLASRWDEKYSKRSFKKRAEKFQELLNAIVPSGTWLDAGCGSGYFSRCLAGRGASVIGVDSSAKMVEEAKDLLVKKYRPFLPKIRFKHVDTIENLELEAQTIDGAICLSVLEYVRAPDECISELYRVLKPGGCLIISAPSKYSGVRLTQKFVYFFTKLIFAAGKPEYLLYSINDFSKDALSALLEKSGFSILRVTSFDPILPRPLSWILGRALFFCLVRKN